jgi:hypothetical protein
MTLTRKQGYMIGGFLVVMLILLLINILLPFGRKREAPPTELAKLRIVSARVLPETGGKRFLEITTSHPFLGDTSFQATIGTKTGYRIEGTGFLSSSERQAGPAFLIDVTTLARFDEPDKLKLIQEQVKAGNIHNIIVGIYRREHQHDPDVFQESRKVTWAEFEF